LGLDIKPTRNIMPYPTQNPYMPGQLMHAASGSLIIPKAQASAAPVLNVGGRVFAMDGKGKERDDEVQSPPEVVLLPQFEFDNVVNYKIKKLEALRKEYDAKLRIMPQLKQMFEEWLKRQIEKLDKETENWEEGAFAMHKPIAQRVPIRKRDSRLVAFPVLSLLAGTPVAGPTPLYLASDVDIIHSHPEAKAMQNSGFYIQGYVGRVPFEINRNIFLCAIEPLAYAAGKIKPMPGAVVEGNSLDAAVYLVCYGKFQGNLSYPITGALHRVDSQFLVRGSEFFEAKKALLSRYGIPLAGNDDEADVKVVEISAPLPVKPTTSMLV